MLKIMLSAVGMHDPYGKKEEKDEGPILGAVRELEPDILFLFPTRKQPNEERNSTDENCRETVEEINKLFPAVKVYERPLNLPDPTDYVNIIKSLKEEIESIKESYVESKVQYYIAISSGTPQMQSAFLVLVSSNRIKAEVYQTINPVFLSKDDKRTRPIEIHFLEEENQIVRARSFFKNINYEESCNELLKLGLYTIYPERARKAEVFLDLISGYHYWDLYQHDKALEELNKVLPQLKRYRFNKLHEIVVMQIKVLREIIDLGQSEGYLNLADLYHNALRRKSCKQYIDCLSRFKRLHEGIYFYVARKDLGIKSPSAKIESQPDWVKNNVQKEYGHLNVYDIGELYEHKKNKSIVSKNLEQELNQIGQQRNYTINNHGMNSVSEIDAQKAMRLIEKLFEHVFSDKNVREYCFSQDVIKIVEDLIFNEL